MFVGSLQTIINELHSELHFTAIQLSNQNPACISFVFFLSDSNPKRMENLVNVLVLCMKGNYSHNPIYVHSLLSSFVTIIFKWRICCMLLVRCCVVGHKTPATGRNNNYKVHLIAFFPSFQERAFFQ